MHHAALGTSSSMWRRIRTDRAVDLLPVDADRDAAERLQLYAGRGDDGIGVEVPTRFQHDAGGVHVIDVVGDHLDLPGGDGLIEVGAEDEAQPLIPRVVRAA